MRRIDLSDYVLGADGEERNRADIEKFFLKLFKTPIENRLVDLQKELEKKPSSPALFLDDLAKIIEKLEDILKAQPADLYGIAYITSKRIREYKANGIKTKCIGLFKRNLLDAFNYEGFRKAKLNRLAVVLNVKSCTYCNQQYTIAVGKSAKKDGSISLPGSRAFLQFDHFFGKAEYPILSMSLYNLIPSCPICNQKKSKGHLKLKFHPYANDISSMMLFRIKNRDAFINPKFNNLDLLDIEIETFGDKDVKRYVEKLELEKRYARHLDIVQETEVAMYMAPYYAKHLNSIIPAISQDGQPLSKRWKSLQRHFQGFYNDPEDINKEPLTKFRQDIYNQLCSWYPDK